MLESLIAPVAGLLDKFIPDADERNRLAHEIATMSERHAHELAKGQIEINKVSAAHKPMSVAGWRIAGGLVSVSDYAGRTGPLENTPAGADVCHDGDDVSGC